MNLETLFHSYHEVRHGILKCFLPSDIQEICQTMHYYLTYAEKEELKALTHAQCKIIMQGNRGDFFKVIEEYQVSLIENQVQTWLWELFAIGCITGNTKIPRVYVMCRCPSSAYNFIFHLVVPQGNRTKSYIKLTIQYQTYKNNKPKEYICLDINSEQLSTLPNKKETRIKIIFLYFIQVLGGMLPEPSVRLLKSLCDSNST